VNLHDFGKIFSHRVRRNMHAYFPLSRVFIICTVKGSCRVLHSFAFPTKRCKASVKLTNVGKRKICVIDSVIEIRISDRKLSADYQTSGWSSTSIPAAPLGQ
jgi:hypothetical protein